MEIRYEIRKMPVGYGYEIFENDVRTWRQEFEPHVGGKKPMSYTEARSYAEALVAELQAAFAASQPAPEPEASGGE